MHECFSQGNNIYSRYLYIQLDKKVITIEKDFYCGATVHLDLSILCCVLYCSFIIKHLSILHFVKHNLFYPENYYHHRSGHQKVTNKKFVIVTLRTLVEYIDRTQSTDEDLECFRLLRYLFLEF